MEKDVMNDGFCGNRGVAGDRNGGSKRGVAGDRKGGRIFDDVGILIIVLCYCSWQSGLHWTGTLVIRKYG